MARRKSVWTLVLVLVLVCPFVYSRPQDTSQAPTISTTPYNVTEKQSDSTIRDTNTADAKSPEKSTDPVSTPNSPRDVKTKTPVIESMKVVATQLLDNPKNKTGEPPIVIDTRIPPKVKNQLATKQKIKTRNEDGVIPDENSHAGVAVPVTMEELEKENRVSESSTSNEGISTWILLSNPANVTSTEPTKMTTEEPQKKTKPASSKNKTKRPQSEKPVASKRPIIASTNKADLVAGGSAINENVYNKLKDTVLSNVQKNKNTSKRTTTVSTTTTTTTIPTAEVVVKKESTTKAPTIAPIKITTKPSKKKNKNKTKTKVSTTEAPIEESESALLPMEPKEQEIELEISTPPTTTKKPKRSSTRKKNKTKKRKTSKPKPETTTTVTEVKTSNKTKTTKTKKPTASSLMPQISSQIYNYFSREVMPSVGLGALGLASLVGIAGYFLPSFFATPVRRTFEVDKKDDIYKHNAEEYASEGNGQPEEEMLGTVLAGMPGHSKHKLNPYAGQTTHVNTNRYPSKKEQDIRYRHVAADANQNNYNNMHYPQQKTGIAHGVYPEPSYNYQKYDTRHVYPTESKYVYESGPSAYTPRPVAVEPVYSAQQTAPQPGPSGISGYGNDASNSVVYGVKPSSDSDFKPVYPFEGQFYGETTNSPMSYPSTSMYLGSNNDAGQQEEQQYNEEFNTNEEAADNKFVVGNVPKELSESATPAVVPEHGPRGFKLSRRKRSYIQQKRSIVGVGSIEEMLKAAQDKKDENFISNEIDEHSEMNAQNLLPLKESETKNIKNAVTLTPTSETSTNANIEEISTTAKVEVVESISTAPIDDYSQDKLSSTDLPAESELTTKKLRANEVFPSSDLVENKQSISLTDGITKQETTTNIKSMNTETTTEVKSDTTSTIPPSLAPFTDLKDLTTLAEESTSTPTNVPTEVLTYPPLNQEGGGIFTFLKRLIEFKYRLGLSILQTTSDNLNRYLRGIDHSTKHVGRRTKT